MKLFMATIPCTQQATRDEEQIRLGKQEENEPAWLDAVVIDVNKLQLQGVFWSRNFVTWRRSCMELVFLAPWISLFFAPAKELLLIEPSGTTSWWIWSW
jgi:hypothetical protein